MRTPAVLVYLASPYAHVDERIQAARYRAAMHVVAESMTDVRTWGDRLVVVYSPIVHNHPVSLAYPLPRTWEFWRGIDFPMLERCDRLLVLRLEGWERSVGVRAEVQRAQELGIPVDYVDAWAEFVRPPDA